jgi:hypothetical protein
MGGVCWSVFYLVGVMRQRHLVVSLPDLPSGRRRRNVEELQGEEDGLVNNLGIRGLHGSRAYLSHGCLSH